MALSIYSNPTPGDAFSKDDSFTKPISITLDGTVNSVVVKKFYVRNDDATKYYSSITLQGVVEEGLDIISGAENGWNWKMISGDGEPIEEEWGLVSPGNSISLSDIGTSSTGDTTTYLPFWLRIESPRNAQVQSFQGSSLSITANENLVS